MDEAVGPDDAELLAAWRGGDERAGDRLLRRHFLVVARFFGRRVEEQLVDELAQRTFMGAVVARDRVPEGVQFKAYLLGIARKQLLRYLSGEYDGARVGTSVDELAAASSLGPSKVVAANQEMAVVMAAVRALPNTMMQQAVELYYCDELTIREISELLERPSGTIKAWLSRARGLLRSAIVRYPVSRELMGATLGTLDRIEAKELVRDGR